VLPPTSNTGTGICCSSSLAIGLHGFHGGPARDHLPVLHAGAWSIGGQLAMVIATAVDASDPRSGASSILGCVCAAHP
jgi:hypothetical protein